MLKLTKLLSKRISNQVDLILEHRQLLLEAVRDEQLVCKHPTLAECDYEPSNYGTALPPLRICLSCGMTEPGWGCGNIILVQDDEKFGVSRVPRNTVYSLRQGLMITNEMKGPLLRKEHDVAFYVNIWYAEATK